MPNPIFPQAGATPLSRNELQAATAAADAARALIVKALLNRDDPRGHPVARDPKSLERRAADRLGALSSQALAPAQESLKDAERLRRARGRFSDADLRGELDAFLAKVEPALGRRVVFYVTAEFLDAYGAALPPRALWRRSLLREPEPLARWALWQYHNRGRVDGIDGPVDLDVFFSGPEAFAAWRRPAADDTRR